MNSIVFCLRDSFVISNGNVKAAEVSKVSSEWVYNPTEAAAYKEIKPLVDLTSWRYSMDLSDRKPSIHEKIITPSILLKPKYDAMECSYSLVKDIVQTLAYMTPSRRPSPTIP